MKIDAIAIDRFAKDEYTNAAPTKVGLNGRDLLIYGENRSGKSLTFNAILYCLLGSQETIELSTGRSNRVELAFTNDVTFARGQPHAELQYDGDETTSQAAIDKFAELLGDEGILKSHFLHSHIDLLPLSTLRSGERLKQIRKVTNDARQQKLDWTTTAVEQLTVLHGEAEDHLRRLTENQPELDAQIASTEHQLETHRTTQSLIESGQFARISNQLQRNAELNAELDDLFTEKEAVRQDLDQLYTRKQRHEGYADEVRDIIAKAVNDFVCPACDRHVSTEEAKQRLRSGYCPYCRQRGDIQEVKDRIGARVEQADEIIDKLQAEINELEQRRADLEAEIEAVKAQQPSLSNLDAARKRLLREHDHNIEAVADETEANIQAAEETLADQRDEREAIADRIATAEQRVEAFEDALAVAEDALRELESTSYEREIQAFAESWTTEYWAMAGDLSFEIGIGPEGEIIVPGGTGDGERRRYDRRGDLSDSELRLLNIAYACALNNAAVEAEVTPWEVLVVDEPFANLDSESTQELLAYFQESDRQYIITTSNDEVLEAFDDYHTATLERGPMQSELGDFVV